MIAIANFAGLVITTLFAAAAAVLLDWVFLQAMFRLMRPAAAGPSRKMAATTTAAFGAELVNGTRQIARHFGPAAVRR